MIDLDQKSMEIILDILKQKASNYEVRIFGSRVRKNSQKFSDVDLAFRGSGKLPDSLISELKQAFSDSNLPYTVDIVDWNAVSPEFRKAVENQGFAIIQSFNEKV